MRSAPSPPRPRTLAVDLAEPRAPAAGSLGAWAQRALPVALVPMLGTTLWLGARADHLARPVTAALYWAYLIAASVLTGVYWWRLRPASRFGPLLALFGICVWVVSWQGASAPAAFDIGVLAEGPFFALTFYLFLAFPTGRIEPPAARWLMIALVAGVAGFFLPWALFSPVIAGGGPLTACGADCPPNALQIGNAPRVVDVAGKAETYAGLAVALGVLVVYGGRLLTASRPQRRALLAVAVTSLLFLPAWIVFNFAAWVLYLDAATLKALQWPIVITRMLLPLGFLIALLQARGFASRAQQALLERLASRPTPAEWRDIVAEALDDPSLRLGYHDPVSGELREAGGQSLRAPADGRRAWVPIAQHGHPVAALELDATLAEDPELIRAAASATLVAVENGALEGELRASETRIAEAGEAERERIRRDLHDSAQQRLIALRIRLMLLGEQIGAPEERAALARLGDEVDRTLDELRDVARGVTPPLLASRGVGAALEAVASRTPVRVSVYDAGIGRPPQEVESAIYFCCVECLQNAVKHAGPDALVSIRLGRADREVRFSIEDDGAGFDPATIERGAGLANLADRVAAVGGRLLVEARVGSGTRVSGVVPA